MLMKRAKFILIIAVMALGAIAATACQSALVQTSAAQPANSPQPTSNYVGEFSINPSHAPIGATVSAVGKGFESNTELELVWEGFTGTWNVADGNYTGRNLYRRHAIAGQGQDRRQWWFPDHVYGSQRIWVWP